eukprot:scaffold25_cov342-Pavlova_lutheri.AAC.63
MLCSHPTRSRHEYAEAYPQPCMSRKGSGTPGSIEIDNIEILTSNLSGKASHSFARFTFILPDTDACTTDNVRDGHVKRLMLPTDIQANVHCIRWCSCQPVRVFYKADQERVHAQDTTDSADKKPINHEPQEQGPSNALTLARYRDANILVRGPHRQNPLLSGAIHAVVLQAAENIPTFTASTPPLEESAQEKVRVDHRDIACNEGSVPEPLTHGMASCCICPSSSKHPHRLARAFRERSRNAA